MVAELKEENRALKERDAEFLSAYKEKLANEKSARADVENARRYSVESERNQRIANFKLAADFAQQEQKAQNEVLEAFGDMLPKVGQYIQEEGERREEAETAAANAAIAQSGLTPDELKAHRQVSWTTDVYNSDKYKDLKARLDAGGISYKQFIDIINHRGIWGRAGARWELIQRAESGSTALTQSITDGFEHEGVPLGAALRGDVPGNDRRVVEEWYRDWYRKNFSGFNPAFIEETIGEDLARFKNSLYATRNKKAETQAFNAADEGEKVELIGSLNGSGEAWNRLQNPYIRSGEKEHYQYVQYQGQHIIELIKAKRISDGQLENYLNTQVWNPSLNKGQGGMNAVRDDPRIMTSIEIAIAERDRQTLNQASISMDMDNLASQQAIHAHKQALETLSPQQSMEYIENVLADPNEPTSVKHALSQYAPKTDPGANYANWKINKLIDERVKAGIPIDPSLLNGASGEVYAKGQKLIAQQNSMAAYDKVFKGNSKTWINTLTGRKTDFDTGHKDFDQVHMLLQRRYKQIQKGLIERRGTNGLTDDEIHSTALKQVEDEWNAGTTGDENKRTGLFRYIQGENPTTGQFTNIYQEGTPRVQPKITEAHKQWGDRLVDQPEAVFTKSRTESFQEGTGAITKSDWDRAWDTADLLGITAPEVIVRQMLANGDTPPIQLVQAADSSRELVKMNNLYKTDLQEVSKLGEQGYGRVRLMRATRDLSTDMTPNNIVSIVRERASGQPGLDLWLEDKRAMALLPGRVKYIGEQYNPDGSGYGVYVTVESLNPITGHLMDVVYAHAAEGSVAIDVGDQLNTGTFIFQQGGTGSVSSYDGTIFSIDFFRAGPPGTGDMTPTPDYQRVVTYIINQIRGII